MQTSKRYRVVQWATGNIGLHALRAVIQHPHLDLVGVYVYSDAKVGRDAGELCGVEPVGVFATRDLQDIVAVKPDCVLYMGDRPAVDTICTLLESGANVVSTRSEFHRPASIDPAVRERIEGACQRGKTSLHSTGSSPGFITEALPLVLSSLERRLDRLTIDEFADLSSRNSPQMLFGLMGFGRSPDQIDTARMAEHVKGSFAPSLGVVADAVHLPLDDIVATTRIARARHRTTVDAGSIEAGTVAAECVEVTGLHHGLPLLQFRSHWFLTPDLQPAWELRDTGWRVQVAGDLPLDIDIHFPVSPGEWAETSPAVTAHRPVNAVPYVCAGPPGLLTTTDLPQVIPYLGDESEGR